MKQSDTTINVLHTIIVERPVSVSSSVETTWASFKIAAGTSSSPPVGLATYATAMSVKAGERYILYGAYQYK